MPKALSNREDPYSNTLAELSERYTAPISEGFKSAKRKSFKPLLKRYPFINSVKFRLIVFFCGVISLMVIVAGFRLFTYLAEAYHEELRSRANLLAQGLATNVPSALISNDKMQMSVLAASIQKNPDVMAIAVLDHNGRVRMHSELEWIDEKIVGFSMNEDESMYYHGGHLDVFRPVIFDGQKVGMVMVRMDATGIEKRTMWLKVHFVIGVTLMVAISCMIFVIIINRFLQPIASLTTAAEKVSRGDMSVKAPVRGGDEIERLALVFNEMTTNLCDASRELQQGYLQTVEALAATVEAKDFYTRNHCERVAAYAEAIARYMGLEEELIQHLRTAGKLHDLGKIGVPEGILCKWGPLNPDEFAAMARHPGIAYEILTPAKFLTPVSEIIMAHHERYDGGGYPSGLAGEKISIAGRILSLADAYDAMTSKRPYRPAMSESTATEIILAERDKQFDPRVVDAFLAVKGYFRKRAVEIEESPSV